jgi:anti-sigma factor RsiW
MATAPLSDEALVGYLDGALPPDRRAEIDALRAEDATLEARLQALDVDVGAIRAAFDAHLASAPVEVLRRRLAPGGTRPQPSSRWERPWLRLAAAVLIGAVLGYGGSRLFTGSPTSDWHVAVAEYQALYTTDTLKPLAIDPTTLQRQVSLAAAALGKAVTVDMLHVEGLELKRAQVLAFKNNPLVQFAYLDPAGTPIAFCATLSAGANVPRESTTIDGLATAFWSKGGISSMVIGGQGTAAIDNIARVLEQRT